MISPKLRARNLGIPFVGTPGPLNAVTDVDGVTVGHVTLVSGDGKLIVGQGPVRTGLTAILPRGNVGCHRRGHCKPLWVSCVVYAHVLSLLIEPGPLGKAVSFK